MAIVAAQHARGARVMRASVEAATGDDEMEAWRLEKVESRRLDTSRTLELIFGTKIDPVTIEPDQKIADALAKVVKQPQIAAKLGDNGLTNPQDTAAFKARLDADFARWLPWLKANGIRAE